MKNALHCFCARAHKQMAQSAHATIAKMSNAEKNEQNQRSTVFCAPAHIQMAQSALLVRTSTILLALAKIDFPSALGNWLH